MLKDWKKIYVTKDFHLAAIVKSVLEENGIDAVIINKQDSMYLFGDIEVYTKNDDIIRGKRLLKDNEFYE